MLVSTEAVASRSRLEYWGEIVCRNFCEADFDRRVRGGEFHGSVDLQQCGSIGLGRIRASAQHVIRTPVRIAQSNRALFFLCLQLRGRGHHRQAGREAQLSPGDFALVDTTQPYDHIFTEDFSQLVLSLPHDWVTSRIPDAPRLTARAASGRTGTGRVTSTFLRQLALQLHAVGEASLPTLQTTLLELVAAALGEQWAHGSGSRTSERHSILRQCLLQYIEANLGDPDLSCGSVARQHRISERHLRTLFEDLASSPSEWIWGRRLERARQDLSAASGMSVTEVCFRWGFKDTAHFSHAFKARFGCTPSEARALPTASGQVLPLT
jgi:AraC-like DNA-binding protein